MPAEKSYARLGLFIVVTLLVVLVTHHDFDFGLSFGGPQLRI